MHLVVTADAPGTVVLQQYGVMDEDTTLYYGIVPGSGTGELTAITGTLTLDTSSGDHRVTVHYRLP